MLLLWHTGNQRFTSKSNVSLTEGDTDIRRRLRELKEPAYTGVEYEKSDNRQRGVEEVVKKMEGMQGVQEETTTSAWGIEDGGYLLYDKSLERTHVLLKQLDWLDCGIGMIYTRLNPTQCLLADELHTCWYCT
jgi:hypothetical protein